MQDFNYHTHTYRCGHAQSDFTDEDYVLTFIKNGFKKICFTDHVPMKNKIDKRTNMRMDYSAKEEYYESIKSLKQKYQDKIKIELGFEVEYLPCNIDELLEIKKEVNKIILGQHFVLNKNNELKIFRQADFTDEELLLYGKYIEKACEMGLPDIIAHPDIYMLNRNTFGKIEEKVAHMVCKAAEKYNVPLEINLNNPCYYYLKKRKNIIYPCREFWQIASNYNIKVLYGIDAHFKEQIDNYKESIQVANDYIGMDIIEKLNFIKK